jgi:hypothetical protein
VQRGLGHTWKTVFPEAQILTGPDEHGFATQLLFGGPATPLDFSTVSSQQIAAPLTGGWQYLKANVRNLSTSVAAPLWTDDRVPVDLWMDAAYRKTRPAMLTRPRQNPLRQ